MKVALVTNWGDNCSISEYAKNMLEHLPTAIDVKVVGHPLTFDNVYAETRGADVIHINHIGYWMEKLVDNLVGRLAAVREPGQKISITYQETPGRELLGEDSPADAIVLHEPRGNYSSKVHLIPNGIRLTYIADVSKEDKIGSCGFSAPHKGFDLVAKAANDTEQGCLLLMPVFQGNFNAGDIVAQCRRFCVQGLEIDDIWLPYDEVIRRMAECAMSIFPYDRGTYSIGIGNAVRFGLAANHPVLVTKDHSHFRDLVDYPDEVYFIENNDVTGTVRQVLKDIDAGCEKRPNKLLADKNWQTCARMYEKLWGEL